jgi:hypothetical protein
MEVPCRGAGPEPRPPLAFVGIPGNSSGEEEETGENGRVERGGRDRRGLSRKDVQRGGRIGWRTEVGGEWLAFEVPVPLER